MAPAPARRRFFPDISCVFFYTTFGTAPEPGTAFIFRSLSADTFRRTNGNSRRIRDFIRSQAPDVVGLGGSGRRPPFVPSRSGPGPHSSPGTWIMTISFETKYANHSVVRKNAPAQPSRATPYRPTGTESSTGGSTTSTTGSSGWSSRWSWKTVTVFFGPPLLEVPPSPAPACRTCTAIVRQRRESRSLWPAISTPSGATGSWRSFWRPPD